MQAELEEFELDCRSMSRLIPLSRNCGPSDLHFKKNTMIFNGLLKNKKKASAWDFREELKSVVVEKH